MNTLHLKLSYFLLANIVLSALAQWNAQAFNWSDMLHASWVYFERSSPYTAMFLLTSLWYKALCFKSKYEDVFIWAGLGLIALVHHQYLLAGSWTSGQPLIFQRLLWNLDLIAWGGMVLGGAMLFSTSRKVALETS